MKLKEGKRQSIMLEVSVTLKSDPTDTQTTHCKINFNSR